jgi:hypothetical protein
LPNLARAFLSGGEFRNRNSRTSQRLLRIHAAFTVKNVMSRNVSQFERHAAPPDDGWAMLSQIEPGPATAPETQTTSATANAAGASAGPAGAPPLAESPAVANAGHTILDDSPIVARWAGSPAKSPPGTDESPASVGAATGSRAVTRSVVAVLLAIHAGLLAWQAYRYSPTMDEPAHMAAGISHWKFGRFDLYVVSEKFCNAAAEEDFANPRGI